MLMISAKLLSMFELFLYILTDRNYPSENSVVISIHLPECLNPDQMWLNFSASIANTLC